MKVIEVGNRFVLNGIYPKAFIKSINYPVRYHEDIEKQFYLVEDEVRFALGITWFCKKCDMEVWQAEMLATDYGIFFLTELKCRNCGNWFLMSDMEPHLENCKFIVEIEFGK